MGDDYSAHATTGNVASTQTPRASKIRMRILDAAARLMADNGYARTSMRDIAAQLDMSAASLYHYFPSKDQLVDALQRRCLAELRTYVEYGLRDADGAVERLCTFISHCVRYYRKHHSLMRVFLQRDASPAAIESTEKQPAHTALCRELIEAIPRPTSAPPIDSRIATFALMGMICAHSTDPSALEINESELVDHLAQIFLRGLQGSESVTSQHASV